eukprot:6463676-Lingulodinium_polyedra.AAC.1
MADVKRVQVVNFEISLSVQQSVRVRGVTRDAVMVQMMLISLRYHYQCNNQFVFVVLHVMWFRILRKRVDAIPFTVSDGFFSC